MRKKELISKNLENFYNQASEETRLNEGMGMFEFERIQTLIEKYLPKTAATIIDVGGGTGKYSEWLAKKGHNVHLVEPVSKHIQLAKNRANKLKNKFNAILGEARNLELNNDFADVVILHGPLYHLQQKEDRALAIQEAKRVVKNDGIILGFAINYTASTLAGLLQGLIHEKAFLQLCKEELTTGVHNPPKEFPWLLAEAYYHQPQELKEEFEQQRLTYINTYAVEGITWLDKEYFVNMLTPKKKKNLLELNQITENDPNLIALSPHMMIAVRK